MIVLYMRVLYVSHRLNQLEMGFWFLPHGSCPNCCGMICTMSPGTRAGANSKRKSSSCYIMEPEMGERNKKKMDGWIEKKRKKNGAVMGLSSRRFVVMEQETSREGNRIVVPSFFSSPPRQGRRK